MDGITERTGPLANFLATPRPTKAPATPAPAAAPVAVTCALCKSAHPLIASEGGATARLLFLSEGPAVKASDELLGKIIEAMKVARDEVSVARLFPCSTPGSGAPELEAIQQTFPELQKWILALSPSVIVTLGSTATSTLLGPSVFLDGARGKGHSLSWLPRTPILPTFHPAYLLRNPDAKKLVWEDMKKVLAILAGKS